MDHLDTIHLGAAQGSTGEFREKYIQYQKNIEDYKKTIHDLVFDNIRNDATIAMCIIKWAETLEQIYILSNQQWLISEIANNILRSLKTIGVPESKAHYVYDALKDHKQYSSSIDHSTISQQRTDLQEQFYKQRAKLLREYFKKIQELYIPELLYKTDAQDICEISIDVKESIIKKTEALKIAVCEPKADDFEGTDDHFQEKITYPPTKPAFTQLTDSWKLNIEAREKVYKRLVSEGIESLAGIILLKDSVIRQIAEAIDLDTMIWEPFTDKKYRKNQLQWISIVRNSIEWFKHSASKKYKVEDLNGNFRLLTREAIGGKKTAMLKLAEQIIRLEPARWLLMGIWWEKTADKRGAEFSKELSPKLSDRSIK